MVVGEPHGVGLGVGRQQAPSVRPDQESLGPRAPSGPREEARVGLRELVGSLGGAEMVPMALEVAALGPMAPSVPTESRDVG